MRLLFIGLGIPIVLFSVGCSSIFLHQKDQHAAAKQLVETARDALGDDDSLWSSMESNVEAFIPVERLAIERAVLSGKETDRRRLYTKTWNDLHAELKEEEKEWQPAFKTVIQDIKITQEDIAQAKADIEEQKLELERARPSGEKDGSPKRDASEVDADSGKNGSEKRNGLGDRVSELLTEAGTKLTEITDAMEGLLPPMTIKIADKYVGFAGKLKDAVDELESSASKLSQEGWPLDSLLEVLRNAGNLELITDLVVAGETFSDDARITDGYAKATQLLGSEPADQVVTTVEELRKSLPKKEEVGTELIRLRLRRDMTASRVESLQVDLAYLRERVTVLEERAEVMRERLKEIETVFDFVETKLPQLKVKYSRLSERPASGDDGVFFLIRYLLDTLRSAYATLPVSKDPDEATQAKDYNRDLASATFALQAAAAYVRLNGELAVREGLTRQALARAQHIYSIRRSRVMSRTWQRLLMNGAEGLEAYWAGGITPEDLAIIALLVGQVTTTAVGVAR